MYCKFCIIGFCNAYPGLYSTLFVPVNILFLPTCSGFPHGRGRDEEDDDQPYNPQYESLPAPRPMKPPEYKPTPEYPSSSVITSRTPVPYNGSSSMMEMQKVSNTDLSKGNMYNYNSTGALTKQVCNI